MKELEEQILLIEWWDSNCTIWGLEPEHLFSIPNDGCTSRRIGARLKASGRRAGVPDLFLAVPRGGLHGLFIELKQSKAGAASPAQKSYCNRLREQGFEARVVHGFDAAKALITSYLGEV